MWVFGMLERESNRIILYPVNDRKKETLIPLIRKHVKVGSTIYSDGWSAHCDMNSSGYKHFSVIHKYAFKKEYKKCGDWGNYFGPYVSYGRYAETRERLLIFPQGGRHKSHAMGRPYG